METKQKAGQNPIRVKDACLVFTVGNEEISLPKLGYIPRNDDILHIYNAEGETGYSFENSKGELQAIYSLDPDGNMIFKRSGKEEVHISKESLAEMKKNDMGSWHKDFDMVENHQVMEYVPDLSMKSSMKLLAGSLALGLVEPTTGLIGAGIATYACGSRLIKTNTKEKQVSMKIKDMRTANIAGGR